MRWTFLRIYSVTLYSEDGLYKPDKFPQALEIVYHRKIKSKALVKATKEQMQHIGFEHPDSEVWFEQLSTLWPDIRKGDTLLFEIDKNKKNRFSYNGAPLGGISNTDFSEGFINIWLSPKTSEPKLREQLINF